jgi:hypothetical protein
VIAARHAGEKARILVVRDARRCGARWPSSAAAPSSCTRPAAPMSYDPAAPARGRPLHGHRHADEHRHRALTHRVEDSRQAYTDTACLPPRRRLPATGAIPRSARCSRKAMDAVLAGRDSIGRAPDRRRQVAVLPGAVVTADDGWPSWSRRSSR